MQVDLSTVLSVFSGVVSVAFALYLATAKYAIGQREKEIDRRIEDVAKAVTRNTTECGDEIKRLTDRLGAEEKATIRQDGAIQLAKQTHDTLNSDIEEIKHTMVTKAEWEPRMNNMERTLNQILTELRGSKYFSHSSMQAVPSPLPPKPKT